MCISWLLRSIKWPLRLAIVNEDEHLLWVAFCATTRPKRFRYNLMNARAGKVAKASYGATSHCDCAQNNLSMRKRRNSEHQ